MKTNYLYNENCLDTMAKMPDNFIDLTVTSPPYDNLRDYKGYSFDFESIAKELYRTTKDGGVVVWIVGDATVKGSRTGTSFKQALFFKEKGFNINDVMIWHKPNAMPDNSKTRYNNSFEYMFILSKGTPKTFKPILIDCAKYHLNWAVNASYQRTKNGGKKLIKSVKNKQKKKHNIFDFNIGRRQHTDKIEIAFKHPATFPEQLANDHIISWSNEGDVVYDCFAGSGTTAKMSIINKRKWIGSEMSSEYCDIIHERLKQFDNDIFLNDND